MGSNLFSSISLKTEKIIGNINKEPYIDEHVIVENGIEKYIELPCIKACQKLWELNIVTFESSGNKNGGWIAINYASLSEENKMIFDEKIEKNVEGYSNDISYKSYSGIYILNASSEEEVSTRLTNLASVFQMQDVKEGVLDKEGFLISEFDCYNSKIDDCGHIIQEFDSKKMEKTFEEYVAEKEVIYIPEEGMVYSNNYYLQKHNNYLKWLASNKSLNKEGGILDFGEKTDTPATK